MCIDVDGCLLNSERELGPKTIKVIQEISSRGVIVIIASGRSHESLFPILANLGANGKHVAGNGAVIINHPDKQVRVFSRIPYNEIANISKLAHGLDIPWAAFGKHRIYVFGGALTEDKTQTEKLLLDRGDITEQTTVVRISNLSAFDWNTADADVFKIWCFLSRHETSKENELGKVSLEVAHICRTTDETVEFFGTSTNKIDAVKEIIDEICGGDKKKFAKMNVLAIGDNENDIDIMRWAHHAVAPANASLSVRKLKSVDLHTLTNDEDFIPEVIKTYYQISAREDL